MCKINKQRGVNKHSGSRKISSIRKQKNFFSFNYAPKSTHDQIHTNTTRGDIHTQYIYKRMLKYCQLNPLSKI